MPISKALFKRALREKTATEVCNEHIFDSDIWLFSNASTAKVEGTYDQFKQSVATQLNVNVNSLGIVGSAKLGFSVSPTQKSFRDFGKKSDIDLVIANEKLFHNVWDQFLNAYYASGTHILDQHSRKVFRKFVVVSDTTSYESTYLRELSAMLDEMKRTVKNKHRIPRTINYRIYASWDDAQRYHVHGIEKLMESTKNVIE